MKHLLTSFFLFISTISSVSAQTAPQRSVEAEHLLQCLKSIEGKETLSGTMANVNWNLNEAKWVHKHTGKWPALNGFDYIHHPFSSKGGWIDYTNINEVASWNSQGGVVCIMFNSSILKSSLSVPQTALVSRLKIDSIVVIMKLFFSPFRKSTTSGMVKNYVAFRRCYGYLGKVLMQNTTQ